MEALELSRKTELPEGGFAAGRIRVVLFGDIQLSRMSDKWADVEFVRCKEASHLRTLFKDAVHGVLLVDPTRFTESGRIALLRGLARLNVLLMAFSDASDDASCESLLRAGFVGLLRPNASAKTVVRAVRSVAKGQLWFPLRAISRLLKAILFEATLQPLTSREMEIVSLIGRGLNNQQIADRLFICRETVRWHVRGIHSKLGIEDRRGAREYLRSVCSPGKPMGVQPERGKQAMQRSMAAG
jgi:DNA-binding NarL/FixJ family response regulator